MSNNSKFKPLIFISGIYLLLIIIFTITDLPKFKEMNPNEWGDFWAGTFAPLAFLWLVFGYYQQGQELKQNTEALRLQAEELKNAVEEQRHLVEITKNDFNLSMQQFNEHKYKELIQAQPYFHIKNAELLLASSNISDSHLKFILTNSRAICRDLKIYVENILPSIVFEQELLKVNNDNEEYTCLIYLHPLIEFEDELLMLNIVFHYDDAFDNTHRQKFRFTFHKQLLTEESKPTFYRANRYFESYKFDQTHPTSLSHPS